MFSTTHDVHLHSSGPERMAVPVLPEAGGRLHWDLLKQHSCLNLSPSPDGDKFRLLSSEKSLLPYLGFGKNTYFSKNKYIAENSLDVGDNIFYLVIANICSEPMFRIDMDSDEPYIEKLLELDSDIEIDRLYIQFYKTKTSLIKNDSEYS